MSEELKKLLEDLLYVLGAKCRFDHHGYCQEHFLEEGDQCVVARIKKELDK